MYASSMLGYAFQFSNILDANGFGIAITGMLIVFTALILISVFIAGLPRLTAIVNKVLPPVHHHGAVPAAKPADDGSEAVAVAIGFALHTQKQADKG